MTKKEIEEYNRDMDLMADFFKKPGPWFSHDQDFIYQMLLKYIDPNHYRPIANCNCTMSYGMAFNKLRDWWSLNNNKYR